ncbi:MAG: T9SS type A sorting domain-containing protein [Bacteroidota bacterium]
MKVKSLDFFTTILLLFGISGLNAQTSLPASGGNISGSGGSLSYTLGQVEYVSFSDASGNSIEHGIQQAYELFIVSANENDLKIGAEIRAYPNPANDYLIIQLQDNIKQDYSLAIYNINGELRKIIKLEENETKITMEEFVPSVYFIKIFRKNKIVKSLKIIKK